MTEQFDDLLKALEVERRYVAKELHDGVAQTTLQLGLQAGICRKLLDADRLDMLTGELAQLEERILLASKQVREIISDMRPPMVEADAGLDDYVQYVIDIHTQRDGPPISYKFDWSDQAPDLSSPQVLALVRIIQETLLNIRKHAQAHNIRLTLSAREDNIYVTIADDGKGFDLAEVESRLVDKGGAGLTNLHMRAKAIGGKLAIARVARTLGTRLEGGVPHIAAPQIVRNIVNNVLIAQVIDKAVDEIQAGKSLAAPLAQSPWFPPVVIQMITAGEQSGKLEKMLNKIADTYESEAESNIMAMTSMLEPVMILVMAVFVGFILISILLPIFEMNQMIK